MPWRLLSTPPFDGPANMAVDVWLMGRARATGESVFRVYRWRQPTLSLGRNQTASDRYDRDQLEQRGIDVVRRPTGGRAILHWREVTYSVTAPAADIASLAEDYAAINGVIVHALRALGAAAEVAAGVSARRPDATPCFAEPSGGEIVLRGPGSVRKVVGSAQCREDGALLQHGSILLHDDQPMLGELTRGDVDAVQPATLAEALGREVTADEVETALFAAVRELLDDEATAIDPAMVRAGALAQEQRFRDSLWTWRR